MRSLLCLAIAALLPAGSAPAPAGEDAAARAILDLVLAAQPSPEALPEGSTYNYVWAQNMMAWMAAERCGYIPREEAVARLRGLLSCVSRFETHHGFFFDSYDPATGRRTTDKVYMQGWWLWALLLTREAYPEAAPLASSLLDAVDYDAAGMINADRSGLAADVFADSGRVSFWFHIADNPAGEFRLAPAMYTHLTGDPTPWLIGHEPAFIDIEGHRALSTWHHFVFDPFYVHLAQPEFGHYSRSWNETAAGARAHREANGMEFFATRMEPLEAWELDPERWPNTEHRVAKPWITWIIDPEAPVMDRAWAPGYGVTQLFDNWDFSWAPGVGMEPCAFTVGASGETQAGEFAADFELELLPREVQAPHPPVLAGVRIAAEGSGAAGPALRVAVNGIPVGTLASDASEALLVPPEPVPLRAHNTLQITASGEGGRRLLRGARPFRPVRWRGASSETWQSVDAPAVSVSVEGQRAACENPFAFLSRCAGVHGFFVWRLADETDALRDTAVAWVGDHSRETSWARVIHSVSSAEVEVTHHLGESEQPRQWAVDELATGAPVSAEREADALHWTQAPHQTVRLREL